MSPMRRSLILAVMVVACGDNDRPCDYVERHDATNAEIAEKSHVTLGVAAGNLCGQLDPGHFDAPTRTIDVDTFRITVDGSGQLLVELTAEQGVELLDRLSVRVFDTAVNPRLFAAGEFDPTLADHGAFLAEVTPGSYDVVVGATAGGSPTGAIPYRVRISASPAATCPTSTRAANYTEAHDGAGSDNDVVDVDFSAQPSFTPSAADDAVERTGLGVVAGDTYRVSGSSAGIDHGQPYLDRDTYELRTDETTNELAIRLDWVGAVDLDYAVFTPDTLTLVATGNLSSTTDHELEAFAVRPSSTYWLWVGQFMGTPGTATSYDATICGGHFFQ